LFCTTAATCCFFTSKRNQSSVASIRGGIALWQLSYYSNRQTFSWRFLAVCYGGFSLVSWFRINGIMHTFTHR
jgi:hypothetical protein